MVIKLYSSVAIAKKNYNQMMMMKKSAQKFFLLQKSTRNVFFCVAASAPETRNSFLNIYVQKRKMKKKNVVRGLRSCPMALMNIETLFFGIFAHIRI